MDGHIQQEISHPSATEKKMDVCGGQRMPKNSAVNEKVPSGRDITQMSGEDLRSHFISSGVEFSAKMEEDFKCYVFIAPTKGTENLEAVVQTITYFKGYEMHKTVGCSQRICHLYVKYESECIAITARDFLRSKYYHAEIVDDMLRLWYAFEKAPGSTKCSTTAWLTKNGKYLTSESANLVLSKYGNPDIKAVMDKTVKVHFNSLAEAFGACIALGPWCYNNMLTDRNYYSLKIELSYHTSKIMRMCNMTNVAREFDYFVQNDPPIYSKTISSNSNKTKPHESIEVLEEIKPVQPVKVSRCSDKRPNRFVQKNRNGGRIYKRNYGNFPPNHHQIRS